MPPTRPVVEGVTSGIAFALGAAVPLAITLAVSAAVESWTILVAAVASLTLTSLVASGAGDLSVLGRSSGPWPSASARSPSATSPAAPSSS